MRRKLRDAGIAFGAALVLYLLLWPVPIDPVAWDPPVDAGLTGPFAPNDRIAGTLGMALGGHEGPEDASIDPSGRILVATHDGTIVRLAADGSSPEDFARTGGRPLGIEHDRDGNLLVADAFRGLLSIAPDGAVTLLADEAEGVPIRYADDVDVAADGIIYVSDASTKFGAEENGGTLPASLLDIFEHGGHGRLLAHDRRSGTTRVVLGGLQFANGVAVDPAQRFVLVAETGSYRVLRVWLQGPKAGTHDVLVDNLPGFPDNVEVGREGRFWIGLAAPRNAAVDTLAGTPSLRKVVQRLPAAVRPRPARVGHVLAVDDTGAVVASLQDPTGSYAMTTGALETKDFLFVTSLTERTLARSGLHVLAPR